MLPSILAEIMSDPTALANAQIDLFNDSMTVWRRAAERMFLIRESDAEPARDKRFKHPDSIPTGPSRGRSRRSTRSTPQSASAA